MPPKRTKAAKQKASPASSKRKTPVKKPVTKEESDDGSDDSEEEMEVAPVKKAPTKAIANGKKAKKVVAAKESSSEEESDSDEEPPTVKKPAPAESSSEEEESEEEEKAAPKRKAGKAAKAPPAKKAKASSDEESGSEEESAEEEESDAEEEKAAPKRKAGKAAKAPPAKKAKTSSDEESGSEEESDEEEESDAEEVVLHVGNLSEDINDKALTKFFKKNDVVIEEIRRSDNDNISNYCFVVLADGDDLQKALALSGETLKGQELKIAKSNKNKPQKEKKASPAPVQKVAASGEESLDVFVKNMPEGCTSDDLTGFFDGVSEVRIPKKHDGAPKGFAFITFDSVESRSAAVEKNGEDLNGSALFVELTKKKKVPTATLR